MLVIEPVMLPGEAAALIRASMIVEPTTPPLSGNVNDICQVEPPSSETSTPAGGVMTIGACQIGAADRVALFGSGVPGEHGPKCERAGAYRHCGRSGGVDRPAQTDILRGRASADVGDRAGDASR